MFGMAIGMLCTVLIVALAVGKLLKLEVDRTMTELIICCVAVTLLAILMRSHS